MQHCCVLPMTSAAFKTLPGNSGFYNSSGDDTSLQIPHSTHPAGTSQQHLERPWHMPALLNSSTYNTPAAAAAAAGPAAALQNDWPLLPSDDSAGSNCSGDRPTMHRIDATSATDTIVNVLLLLGGSSTSTSPLSSIIEAEPCEAAAGAPSAMHSAASSSAGCPPNAPVCRPPPVMLLPAQELPGLLPAGQ
jgi:hypothetical protein